MRFDAVVLLRRLLLCSAVILLAACSSKEKADEADTRTVEELYTEAKTSLDNESYERAVRMYKLLTSRFPFGEISEQAQLDLAYAQFERGLHDDSLSTINRFIKTYPAHPKIDYAYYLRGLINFDRNRSYLDRLLPQQAGNRDTASARSSFNDFAELLRRYPDSSYAPDARQRMLYLVNDLANYEMTIAEYYWRRGAYVAAAGRAKYVIENYQQSDHMPDALAMLIRCYTALGQEDLAADARRILDLTAPGHVSGSEQKRSWWRRVLF